MITIRVPLRRSPSHDPQSDASESRRPWCHSGGGSRQQFLSSRTGFLVMACDGYGSGSRALGFYRLDAESARKAATRSCANSGLVATNPRRWIRLPSVGGDGADSGGPGVSDTGFPMNAWLRLESEGGLAEKSEWARARCDWPRDPHVSDRPGTVGWGKKLGRPEG
jgi:hypothetical protein